PDLEDVLWVNNASGAWETISAQGAGSAPPTCLRQDCTGGDECALAHPKDLELCASEEGFAKVSAATSYDALYLGFSPNVLQGAELPPEQRGLVMRCAYDND